MSSGSRAVSIPRRRGGRSRRLAGAEIVSVDAGALRLAVEGATQRLPALFHALSQAGAEIQETTLTQPSLETLFIKLTGRALRE